MSRMEQVKCSTRKANPLSARTPCGYDLLQLRKSSDAQTLGYQFTTPVPLRLPGKIGSPLSLFKTEEIICSAVMSFMHG